MLPYARMRFQLLDQERELDARGAIMTQNKIVLHAAAAAMLRTHLETFASSRSRVDAHDNGKPKRRRGAIVLIPAQPLSPTTAEPTTTGLTEQTALRADDVADVQATPLADGGVVNVFSTATGLPVCSARLGNTSNYASFTPELMVVLRDWVDWAKFWRIPSADVAERNAFLLAEIQRARRKRKDHVFVDEKVRARYKNTPLPVDESEPLGVAIVALLAARREHAALRAEKTALLASASDLEVAAIAEMESNHWKSVPVKHAADGQKYTMTRCAAHVCVRVTVARLRAWVADAVSASTQEGDTAELLARLFHLVQTRERLPATTCMQIAPLNAPVADE